MDEIDLETALREWRKTYPDTAINATLSVNNEGRVVITLQNKATNPSFIVFGNNVCSPPTKPPTQRAAVSGFDAHKGMGER